ncbi:lytic transglycosylase domain-containing protein [Alphaproteobacteria bacterium]|nr:lytic transglycosylase domain-containing protein [Alphaproteobacteria bacterium]
MFKYFLIIALLFFNSIQSETLNTKDKNLYKKIFEQFRKGDFAKGENNIAKLENDILLGHVEALKLLHPTKHRSSFLELKNWLYKYNDHYESTRIYKLGVRRMPEGGKSPKKPSPPILEKKYLTKTKDKNNKSNGASKIFTKKNYSKKISIYNTIRSRVGRGWPTGALEYFNQNEKMFSDSEKSFLLSKISNGYYLANLDDKAIKTLKSQAFRNFPYSEGLWIKGLSHYRKKEYEKSSKSFLILSKIANNNWLASAGAYWSFISSSKMQNKTDNIKSSIEALEKTCQKPYNLYSLLSCFLINKPIVITNGKEFKNLNENYDEFSITKLGQRINALLEINEIGIAEFEINRAQKISNDSFKKIILSFAINNDLSSMQIKTTKSLFGELADINLLYPSPKWIDNFNINGIDKNIVIGVIRQESQFSAFAKSGKSAYGLMQVLPSTAKMMDRKKNFLGNRRLLFDPSINVNVGTKYIKSLLSINYIKGDLLKTLISYNAGPGNLSKWSKKITYNDDSFLLIESIPSRETRLFVERVLTNIIIYEYLNNQSAYYAKQLVETNTIILNYD